MIGSIKRVISEGLLTKSSHGLSGMIVVLLGPFYPILSVLGSVIFFLYETSQWITKGDEPSEEILEFGAGFFFMSLILISVRIALFILGLFL